MSRQRLAPYREKRDFESSPEPKGGGTRRGRRGHGDLFVIQQHDATNLHFDVRLEVDGVLRSWAVPKGPSTDPRQKRLAMPTEDHPIEYADFEGRIPEGEYGAGRVIVWDRGTYRNLTTDGDKEPMPMAKALEQGHALVWLDGTKLNGGWAFQRIGHGDRERWLMVKADDERADARRNPVRTQSASVISGRTLDDIEAGE